MVTHTTRLLLVLALLAGSAVGPAPPARAGVSLRVAPARVELAATPGGTSSQQLTLTNTGDAPAEVVTAVEPVAGARPDLSAAGWLAVEPVTFRLEPGQQQAVTVEVAVPADPDLPSGGRYALVTFTAGAGAAEGSGAGIAGRLGVGFLIVVEGRGELVRRATVARFAPVLEPDGRVGFRALQNEGNVHVIARAGVEVGPADGQPLAALTFPETTPILPGSEALLAAQGSLPLPAGTAYRAALSLDYDGGEPIRAETDFAVQPALAVVSAGACENLDRGPTVRLELRNEGDLALLPVVQLSVRGDGRAIGAPPRPEPVLLWPGQTAEVATDVPERLVSGEYALFVRVDLAAPSPDTGETAVPPVEQESTFRVGGLGGDAIPLCPPSSTTSD